jgi:hypothetical protein
MLFGGARLREKSSQMVKVTKWVEIYVVLQASDQQLVTAIVVFCERSMPGMEMMLGLPDILHYFLVVLVTVLQTSKAREA